MFSAAIVISLIVRNLHHLKRIPPHVHNALLLICFPFPQAHPLVSSWRTHTMSRFSSHYRGWKTRDATVFCLTLQESSIPHLISHNSPSFPFPQVLALRHTPMRTTIPLQILLILLASLLVTSTHLPHPPSFNLNHRSSRNEPKPKYLSSSRRVSAVKRFSYFSFSRRPSSLPSFNRLEGVQDVIVHQGRAVAIRDVEGATTIAVREHLDKVLWTPQMEEVKKRYDGGDGGDGDDSGEEGKGDGRDGGYGSDSGGGDGYNHGGGQSGNGGRGSGYGDSGYKQGGDGIDDGRAGDGGGTRYNDEDSGGRSSGYHHYGSGSGSGSGSASGSSGNDRGGSDSQNGNDDDPSWKTSQHDDGSPTFSAASTSPSSGPDNAAALASRSDCAHLTQFYNAMSGPEWSMSNGWASGSAHIDCCAWYGVTCDGGSRVSALDLKGVGLQGSLASNVFSLTGLLRLSVFLRCDDEVLLTGFHQGIYRTTKSLPSPMDSRHSLRWLNSTDRPTISQARSRKVCSPRPRSSTSISRPTDCQGTSSLTHRSSPLSHSNVMP